MNTQLTLDQFRTIKLHGMADAYQELLTLPVQEQPCGDLKIGIFIDAEHALSTNGMISLPSRLPQTASLKGSQKERTGYRAPTLCLVG